MDKFSTNIIAPIDIKSGDIIVVLDGQITRIERKNKIIYQNKGMNIF